MKASTMKTHLQCVRSILVIQKKSETECSIIDTPSSSLKLDSLLSSFNDRIVIPSWVILSKTNIRMQQHESYGDFINNLPIVFNARKPFSHLRILCGIWMKIFLRVKPRNHTDLLGVHLLYEVLIYSLPCTCRRWQYFLLLGNAQKWFACLQFRRNYS